MDNEDVAAFVEVFTNPNTVANCKYLFRQGGDATMEELRKDYHLQAKELKDALAP